MLCVSVLGAGTDLDYKKLKEKNGKEWCVISRHTFNKKHLGLQPRWSVVALLCEKKKQRKEGGGGTSLSPIL